MKEIINERCEAKLPDLLTAIQHLVSIESVEGIPLPDAPFGEGPKEALMCALRISEALGFKTVNIDNKIGYAYYGDDDSEGYIGIFGHVDIVPIGEGWTYPPLGGCIDAGRIYGRGVLDNKGPILTNLYALAILKELNVTFKKQVRIVFGTNEESGFRCVKHYLTKEDAPDFGWTPDCKWPVVYGERGRARVKIISRGNLDDFNQFINEFILSSPSNGVKLGIDYKDDDFGEMVMRGYTLGSEGNAPTFTMSLSYPGVCTCDEIMQKIHDKAPESVDVVCIHNWDPVLRDKTRDEIIMLTDVYEEVMGERLEPVTTTGGTYAKIVPNIIAYGPSFPGQKDIAHLPDEWMNLEDVLYNFKIYCNALYRLKDR